MTTDRLRHFGCRPLAPVNYVPPGYGTCAQIYNSNRAWNEDYTTTTTSTSTSGPKPHFVNSANNKPFWRQKCCGGTKPNVNLDCMCGGGNRTFNDLATFSGPLGGLTIDRYSPFTDRSCREVVSDWSHNATDPMSCSSRLVTALGSAPARFYANVGSIFPKS